MLSLAHVHPMLVHFPIVFILALAVFDVIAVLRGASITSRTVAGGISVAVALLAGASAIVALIFGGLALDVAESGGFASGIAEIHESLGTVTAIAFAVWAVIRLIVWWRNRPLGRGIDTLAALVEVAGAVLVVATAYYGGQLVYDLGVNVARTAVGG